MTPRLGQRVPHVLGGDEPGRQRQPRPHRQRARQVQAAQHDERRAPVPVRGDQPRQEPSHEPAHHRAAHVGRHRPADPAPFPLFHDVGEHHRNHARHEHALQEAPADQRLQAPGAPAQRGGQGQQQQRRNDHPLPPHALRDHADKRRHQRHRENGRAHRQADFQFRGVEELPKIGKQGLGRINIQEGTHAGEHHRRHGLVHAYPQPRRVSLCSHRSNSPLPPLRRFYDLIPCGARQTPGAASTIQTNGAPLH